MDPGIVKIIGWILGGLLSAWWALEWYKTGVFPL